MIVKPGLRRKIGSTAQKSLQFHVNNQIGTQVNRGTGTNTYSRASKAYVQDWEGRIVQVQDNCPSFVGLRKAENLGVFSDNLTGAGWTADPATATATTITFGAVAASGRYQTIASIPIGSLVRVSAVLSVDSGTKNIRFYGGAYSSNILIDTIPRRYSALVTSASTAMGIYNGSDAVAGTVNCTNIQFENVTGATNQNPSEYVPTTSAPLTIWKDYANPYTVDGNGVVTDTGVRTALPTTYLKADVLSEPVGSNYCAYGNNFGATGWVRRGTAAASQNITGPDGVANSGWTISGIGAQGVNDLYDSVNGGGSSARHEPSFWIYKIDTTGVLAVLNSWGIGSWSINFALLPSGWSRITRSHPAITINTEFVSDVSTALGLIFARVSGASTLTFGLFWAQLELGSVSTSDMPTLASATTSTRAATSDSYPNTNSKLGDITVYCEAMFNSLSGILAPIRHSSGTAATTQWEITVVSGTAYFNITNGTLSYAASLAFSPVVGARYKFAGRLSGTTISIFVSGTKGTDATLIGTQSTNTGDITVGKDGTPAYVTVNGYIGPIRIYNTALSDAECIRLTS
jgi:hypothetical protein